MSLFLRPRTSALRLGSIAGVRTAPATVTRALPTPRVPTGRSCIARAPALALALAMLASFGLAQASSHALRFFGTGQNQADRVRIRIDDDVPGADASAPCDVGASSFTLEAWVRGTLADNATSSSGAQGSYPDFRWIEGNIVLDRDIYGGGERDFGVSIAGGRVRFGTGRGDAGADGDNTLEGDVDVLDGLWHHIACVRDAATGVKSIYVDGVLDVQSPSNVSTADLSYPNGGVPSQVTPWGPFLVLAAEKHDAGPGYPSFAGFLDEVRVWSVARTATQLAATWNRLVPSGTSALVGSYRFEEGSGTTVADSSGAGSRSGELVAGVPGNGEWVAWSTSSTNTAPILDPSIVVFCSGDGSGAACPCANEAQSGSGSGCLNSLGTGATLSATGLASVGADSILLVGAGMPNSSALYFQGTTQLAGAAFGDGLRCAGGAVIRLGTQQNVAGASGYPASGDPAVSVRGALPSAGGSRTYQVWYRNAASFCTSATFNLSNGLAIAWSA